jgi:hypothetical protein
MEDNTTVAATPATDSAPAAATAAEPAKKKVPSYMTKYGDTTERVVKDTPPPAGVPLTNEELFDENGKPNVENLKNHFIHEGKLTTEHVVQLIETVTSIFANEPNLLTVDAPVIGKFFPLLLLSF